VTHDAVRPQSVPWWLRAYLLFGAFQGLALGLTGFLLPEEIQIPYQMSPLNARFIAALYLAPSIGVLLSAFARRRMDTRLFVIGFGTATLLILVLTILHWPAFMADPLRHRASWIATYVLDPLLAVVVLLAAGLVAPPPSVRHPFSPLFTVEAVVLGLLGALLLFIPDTVASFWPWAMPPVLGQLYGCFFLALALGGLLAAREPSAVVVRNFLITSLTLTVLVLLASVLHLPRFKPEPVSLLWFASFGVGTVAFAGALVLHVRTVGRVRDDLGPAAAPIKE
jgi:hypothetical protein